MQIGRYQILGELGRGAMGIVYRALDPAIGRPVAIKTIHLADLADEAEQGRVRERLFREAQSAGLLSHQGIVTIYDVGEQEETTYVAMELVEGPTLEKLMCGEAALEPAAVIHILRQTAAALDYAHKKGIVHRDIKPANIMVGEGGVAKITDFGVAKIAKAQQQLTQAGTVIGTPNYMSPEQIRGKPVDGRTDQWALAVMAYELLTGEKPFPGDNLTTVLYKIMSEEPPAPQQLNPSISWAASTVIGRALSKEPDKRYPSATDFVNALEASLRSKKDWKPLPRGASLSLPTAVAPAAAAPTRTGETGETTRVVAGARPIRAWHVVGAALAGLALVAIFFLAAERWFLPREEPQPTTAQTPAQAATQPAPVTPKPAPAAPAKPAPTERAAAPPVEPQAEPAEPPKPEPVKPARTVAAEPRKPAGPTMYGVQFVTNPPGATVTVDGEAARACKTPCSVDVTPGRHTAAIAMDGYQRELRILDINRPNEVFVPLTQQAGTVRVTSEPPGAQILINNEPRRETTPASFRLPVGKYKLSVIRDGRRADQDIVVREGAFLNFDLQLNP